MDFLRKMEKKVRGKCFIVRHLERGDLTAELAVAAVFIDKRWERSGLIEKCLSNFQPVFWRLSRAPSYRASANRAEQTATKPRLDLALASVSANWQTWCTSG